MLITRSDDGYFVVFGEAEFSRSIREKRALIDGRPSGSGTIIR